MVNFLLKKLDLISMQRSTIAIVLVLFLGTIGYFYWSMAHTFAVPSIDGPFYYIQVNNILHTGVVEYADPPLSFYTFTAFTLALGNTVTGVLVGSAFFSAVAAVAAYFLFKHIFKEQIPAIGAGLVVALSAEHIAMSVNLMKNAFGVFFIFGVIFFLQRCLDVQKRSKWNIAGAIGFFFLTLLTHVLDEGVALLFIGGYLVFSLMFKERKQLLRRFGTITAATSLSAVLAFVLVPSYFGDFNKGIIFFSDVTSETSSTVQTMGAGAGGMGVSDPWIYAFLALGVGLTIYEWARGEKKNVALIGSATIIGVALILPFIPTDFAWRFQLMEFISIAIIISYAVSALVRLNQKGWAVLGLVLLLAPVAFVGYQTATSLSPTISSQQYADLTQMASAVDRNNSVLVVQNSMGMAYWPEFLLDLPVVSNSTLWQEKGYTVYVLVGQTGQQSMSNTGGQGGFGGGNPPQGGDFNTGGFSQQGNPGSIQNTGPPQNMGQGVSDGQSNNSISLTNATLVYSGSSYSLYKLNG